MLLIFFLIRYGEVYSRDGGNSLYDTALRFFRNNVAHFLREDVTALLVTGDEDPAVVSTEAAAAEARKWSSGASLPAPLLHGSGVQAFLRVSLDIFSR